MIDKTFIDERWMELIRNERFIMETPTFEITLSLRNIMDESPDEPQTHLPTLTITHTHTLHITLTAMEESSSNNPFEACRC